ncbi:hypothetical protein WR25_15382 [Diploscapter pachys]|uniref:Uncharacterized protein n=1 Tax=Diploscapter pachys TaxID=2018661 RepID=A0A2A2LK38_9BILA|nr:hypothetical protein WR25_15382 [Diploscapter pachys]
MSDFEEFNWGPPLSVSLFVASDARPTGMGRCSVVSMPVRCPAVTTIQSMSGASQFPNDDPFSVDSSHFPGFSSTANSHLTSSTSGKSSILNGNALGPHWRRRNVAAKYAVEQTNGVRLGEQELDAVSSGIGSAMMKESVSQEAWSLLTEGITHTVAMVQLLSKLRVQNVGLIHRVMNVCSELFDQTDIACGNVIIHLQVEIQGLLKMNYEIGALEIMLENEERRMKVCEKAKEEVNEMIERENVFMTMRDNLDAVSIKVDRYKEAKGKLDRSQKLTAKIYEQIAEAAERHQNAMEKRNGSGTLCYDTSVAMSYLHRVRHSLDPIMSIFINDRPLVHVINKFCERARRIETAVGNDSQFQVRPMPPIDVQRRMMNPHPNASTTDAVRKESRQKVAELPQKVVLDLWNPPSTLFEITTTSVRIDADDMPKAGASVSTASVMSIVDQPKDIPSELETWHSQILASSRSRRTEVDEEEEIISLLDSSVAELVNLYDVLDYASEELSLSTASGSA